MYADDSKVGRHILCKADCLALQSIWITFVYGPRTGKCSLTCERYFDWENVT